MKKKIGVAFVFFCLVICCTSYVVEAKSSSLSKGTIVSFVRTGATMGKVKVKKVNKAKKYQIKYSSSKKFSKSVKLTATKTCVTLKNKSIFQKSKNVYVATRYYRGGKWSKWSSVVRLNNEGWQPVYTTVHHDAVTHTEQQDQGHYEEKEETYYYIGFQPDIHYTDYNEMLNALKDVARKIDSGELPDDLDISTKGYGYTVKTWVPNVVTVTITDQEAYTEKKIKTYKKIK